MAVGEVVATAAAINAINRIGNSVSDRIASNLGQKATGMRARFLKTFQSHLAKSLQKSGSVKTVVSKDKPVKLESIYVPLCLLHDEKTIEGDELDPTINAGRRTIVSGTGGAGKTILMKHLLNISVANPNETVPLFFEMRSLRLEIFDELTKALHFELEREGAGESLDLFVACLREGALAIFLDGFDEVHPDRMAQTLRSIESFARLYPLTSIIVSTRPGTGLQDLVDFDVYHLKPLKKEQAIAVVNKTKFDGVSKTNFIKALEGGLYEKHQTMMSLPILVVMMLLTYRSYGDIPDRMTVFYGQAFDTLFAIHDNENKTQYKRVYLSGLAPDQFKQVLESFCYRTLKRHELEFTQDSLEKYVGESIKFEKLGTSTENFKSDLIKNVCILQPDGVNFVFVHRSFQEYFAARFALRYSGQHQFQVIDRIVQNRGGGVARMMDEINRPKFYREWLLPTLERFAKEIALLKNAPPWESIGVFFDEITFKAGAFVSASSSKNFAWSGALEVANTVSTGDISFISLVPDLRLVHPMEDQELRQDAMWSSYIKYEPEGDSTPTEMEIFVPVTAENAQILAHVNSFDALSKFEHRLGLEIARVSRFVEEQVELEDELLEWEP